MKTNTLILVSILVLVGLVGTSCAAPAPPTVAPAVETPAAAEPTPTEAADTPVPAEPTPTEAAERVSIRWGIYADPGRFKAAEAQVAAFQEAHPNIEVTVEQAPFGPYYDKMSSQILAGTLYDVFMMSGANFQNFAPKGGFEDLTPYLEEAGIKLEDYTYEEENAIHEGKILCVPYELDIQALYYNKDLFDKAEVEYPDDTWTWDDLLKAAQELTITMDDGTTEQWGFFSQNLYPSYVSFIAQNGGSVLNEEKTECTLDSPEANEAVQFMVDLIHEYKVSPLAGQLPSGANPFHTGTVAMRIDGSYSVNPTLEVPFNWDVAPLPQEKNRGVAYWTQAICMFNKTSNKDAAWTFVEFLLSDEGQTLMAETKMSAPSKKSIASSPVYLEGPPDNLEVFVESYEDGRSLQFTPEWFQIMAGGTSVIAQKFEPVWLGDASVEEATTEACQEIDQISGIALQ